MQPLITATTTFGQNFPVIAPQFYPSTLFAYILAWFYSLDLNAIYQHLLDAYFVWKIVATFFSLLLIIGIIWVSEKYMALIKTVEHKLRQDELATLAASQASAAKGAGEAAEAFPGGLPGAEGGAEFVARQERNAKWQRLLDHSASDNPNDWRLAILEADLLLEELLEMKHAFGDTLGDKLKSMTLGDMPSLQKAWEAHKTRNRIAHEGSDFVLPQREARRVISLYEDVLREGGFIS